MDNNNMCGRFAVVAYYNTFNIVYVNLLHSFIYIYIYAARIYIYINAYIVDTCIR